MRGDMSAAFLSDRKLELWQYAKSNTPPQAVGH